MPGMGGQRRAGIGTTAATVRVSGPAAILGVLRQLGADPAAIFAEARIDPALFDDPSNLMPLAALGRLGRICVARTGCQHFGLLVGKEDGMDSLGLAGLLAKNSPDVDSALRSLVAAMHLHIRGVAMAVTVDDDVVIVNFDISQPNIEAATQIEDGSLAHLFNVVRDLCGPGWLPSEVRFAHRKPQDVRPFRQFFQAPLRFDADQNALVFSRNWLNRRLPGASTELRRLVQKEIDALDATYGEEFPQQVRSVLRAALLTGHGSAEQVAALFSMHSRTLSRRLRSFGTSFQELVDETRFEIASHMLRHTAMDVTDIAASLDYADTSAFTRAFRRWSGTTPGRWRAAHGASDLP